MSRIFIIYPSPARSPRRRARPGHPRLNSHGVGPAKTWVPGTRPGTGLPLVIRDFDEVLVGVADIDGLHCADSAGARPGAGDDRHAAIPEMRDDLGERRLGDKAEIAGARGWLIGDQAGDVVSRMQIDLLLAETQRGTALAKSDDLHPENARVELAGLGDIGDGQDE